MSKPTKRMLAFLAWVEQQGTFHTWSISDGAIKRRAELDGYLVEGGEPERRIKAAGLRFAGFRLSARGRQALAEAKR